MDLKNIVLLLLCTALSAACSDKRDAARIRQLLSKTFDRPGSSVQAHAVVVQDNYAIVDWAQDAKAGRAMLQMHDGDWQLSLCGGRALKNEHYLIVHKIPEATSHKLVEKLNAAEAALGSELIGSFDSFGPSVKFSESHGHHSN